MLLLPLKRQTDLGPSSGTHQLLVRASLPSTVLSPRLGRNHWAKNSWKSAWDVEESHLQGPEHSTNLRLLSIQVSCTSYLLKNCLNHVQCGEPHKDFELYHGEVKKEPVLAAVLFPIYAWVPGRSSKGQWEWRLPRCVPTENKLRSLGFDCIWFKFHEWQSLAN